MNELPEDTRLPPIQTEGILVEHFFGLFLGHFFGLGHLQSTFYYLLSTGESSAECLSWYP